MTCCCGNDQPIYDEVVLTDEFVESIEDAIEDAMSQHEPLRNDSVCSCGAKNNMDGDVLFSHRVGAVTTAVRHALGLT